MKLLIWIGLGFVTAFAARGQDVLDCHAVPGWEAASAKRQYTPDNLFDYRDGAAEGYLQFGFARMQGIDCRSGAQTMAIDVSEMSDAEMAYGMFAANRDFRVPITEIGMGAQVQPQSLTFAKGRYFVELVITDAAADADFKEVLRAFAAQMEKRLEGQSTRPEILRWFPAEDLQEVRLVPESVLGLRMLKRGYVAKYEHGQAFILQEASPESAAEVLRKLKDRYAEPMAVKVGEEGFQAQAPYLGGMAVFRKGRYVAGYTNLANPEEATVQASKLARVIP